MARARAGALTAAAREVCLLVHTFFVGSPTKALSESGHTQVQLRERLLAILHGQQRAWHLLPGSTKGGRGKGGSET